MQNLLRFSACVIVKNEESCLGRLLKSLEGCPEIIVLDTGSTDRTKEMAAGFPGVKVHDFIWTHNFAEARNAAASQAQHSWVMWLDADMYFPPGEIQKVLALLPQLPPNIDSVSFKICDTNSNLAFPSPRLYRKPLFFTGVVHEDLNTKATCTTPFVIYHDRPETPESLAAKETKYLDLLRAEYASNPKSPHALLYLRDAAYNDRDYPTAERYCRELLELQEDYFCHYVLAQIALQKNLHSLAIDQGLSALKMCPFDPRVYGVIADAHDKMGKKMEALTWYDHARLLSAESKLLATKYALTPDDYNVIPLTNKAKVLVDLGRIDKALECYQEALRINPQTSHRAVIEQNLVFLKKLAK